MRIVNKIMEIKTKLLKALPKVDECIGLLNSNTDLIAPSMVLKAVVQSTIERERKKILSGDKTCRELSLDEWLAIFHNAII